MAAREPALTSSNATASDAKARPKRSTSGHLRRIARLLAPYKKRWLLATLALVLAGAVNLALPQAVRTAINDATRSGTTDSLDLMLGLALVGFVALGLLTFARHYLMTWLGQRVVVDLRDRTFRHLLKHPPGYFHERKTGELVSRLTSDIQSLQHTVGTELSMALRSALMATGALVILLATDAELTVTMLLIVPPVSFLAVWVGRRIRAAARKMQDLVAAANSGLKESIEGIETVQTFTAEHAEAERYQGRVIEAFDAALDVAVARGGFMGAVQIAAFSAVTIILWLGGRRVVGDSMDPGDLAAFLIYTVTIASGLATLSNIWGNLQRAVGASERIFQLLDETPAIRSRDNAVPLPSPRGEVAFEGVGFSYPSRPDVRVLDDVSFRARPGDTIALVGRSGAGKSTVVTLLARFFDIDDGAITVDGHDLRALELEDLRRAIASVAQDPVLFSGSARDNIAYGVVDATDEAIQQAARDAHIHDFITGLPDGYETLVGERGVKLSGGQRQRIAIARAILADPRILILDEATSHLDTENESAVQAALERVMDGRTTLVIAHRLSTVQDATVILVFDQGRIVERGTHEELLASGTVYPKLAAAQLVDGPS